MSFLPPPNPHLYPPVPTSASPFRRDWVGGGFFTHSKKQRSKWSDRLGRILWLPGSFAPQSWSLPSNQSLQGTEDCVWCEDFYLFIRNLT